MFNKALGVYQNTIMLDNMNLAINITMDRYVDLGQGLTLDRYINLRQPNPSIKTGIKLTQSKPGIIFIANLS
jgi:hypothetical protein